MLKLLTKPWTSAFVMGVTFVCMSPQQVLANTQNSGIEVRGQGSVLAVPDVFSLSVSIIEKGHFTDKIRAIVDHKSNQVVDVATNLGIKPENINSARVSLRVIKDETEVNLRGVEVIQTLPNHQKSKLTIDTNSSNNVTTVQPQYFELSRNITINFSDIKDYDQFLNSIIKIGVHRISPLSMSIGNSDKYYQQALSIAIDQAKAKAMQIAKQTEQSLGKLIYVQETSSNHYRPVYSASMKMSDSFEQHSSQVGNQAINASVLVKYSID
ncbi:SIMPL domain-containing protein [Colwellia sp. 6_MG-2023]|uniref:SIMPL domain-containing protein n=1 Tax=Colwellia sp. 6_MG-2023 TaxID=3062676 RepID=UPI0026E41432|nr:SIMPL domain-containing protein [Colwellia sp. 6_MG-2023]MDO6486953.1 SIMPL domain-containing protein [Colwellia sp. 6_MG-2023]